MGNHGSEPLLRFIWVTGALRADCGWAPTTPIDADLPRFVE